MDEPFALLQHFDGQPVRVRIVRAKDGAGVPVVRGGAFRLFDAPAEDGSILTRVIDAAGVPVATFRPADTLSIVDGALRFMLRPTMFVDVREEPFAPAAAAVTYESAARELTAELEAAFRSALLVRPDPDPQASARARHGLEPVEPLPLVDNSLRFAVGHFSATLRPDGEGSVRLTCIGSSVRDGKQFADLFEPAGGATYAFEAAAIERCGADMRAFLAGRRERFVAFSANR